MEQYEIKTSDGRDVKLAMQELWLGGEVLPVGARIIARHVFESAEDDPLEVIYSFMLPRDAALRQFRIVGEGFEVHSELQAVEKAEKTYEEAMNEGYLASMTRNYRDGVTNLMVGNLQPGKRVTVYLEIIAGVEARDDGFRFRFPFTLAPAYHPQASTVVHDGAGEQELPEEIFGDVILPPWRADASKLHRTGFALNIAVPGGAASVQSPSHTLDVSIDDEQCRAGLAREADVPNRDLVLDVTFKERKPIVYTGAVNGKTAVAAWIPSNTFGEVPKQPGRTAFVIDRSGSMGGACMDQAKRALRACLGALSPEDAFNIIAFDNVPELMSNTLVHGDGTGRDMADRFIDTIDARGGTELQQAVFAAADQLEQGGDIFLLTDGQVYETETIINRVTALGVRVHVLGIGSASQDRFLSQLARQTGGTSRFVTPNERVDQAALELFASISSPVAEELSVRIDGKHTALSPAPSPTVHSGNPVLVYGEAEQVEAITAEWKQNGSTRSVSITELPTHPALAQTLRLARGARLITDFEARMETPAGGAVGRREAKRADAKLEQLSRDYGLASRAMSLVAVVESERDASGKLARTRVVPVGMPENVNMDAYFGASAGICHSICYESLPDSLEQFEKAPAMFSLRAELRSETRGREFSRPWDGMEDGSSDCEEIALSPLLDLAAELKPDGGLPGDDEEQRVLRSLLALICLVADGSAAYHRHVVRLMEFLESAVPIAGLPDTPGNMAEAIRGSGIDNDMAFRSMEKLCAGKRIPIDLVVAMYDALING